MNQNNKVAIVVQYYGDPTKVVDDHDSEPIYLTQINERRFVDVFEAIRFLQECNNPITVVDEILPLPKRPKGFKFILPEKNIKIKHQADNALDSKFDLDAMDWG